MNPIMQGIHATALLADEPLPKAPPAKREPAAWVVMWRPMPRAVGATRRFIR